MKRFVLSIVAAAVAMLAAAQWSVAPKAGLNWSKVNFPESAGRAALYDARIGLG